MPKHLYIVILLTSALVLASHSSAQTVVDNAKPPLNRVGFLLGQTKDASSGAVQNWICTATLISPDRIVTAAHCVFHDKKLAKRLSFMLGTEMKSWDFFLLKPIGQEIGVKAVFSLNEYLSPKPSTDPNPEIAEAVERFSPGNFDIAVLQLQSSISLPPLAIQKFSETGSLCVSGFPMMNSGRMYQICAPSVASDFFAKYLPNIGLLNFNLDGISWDGLSGSAVLNDRNEIVGVLAGTAGYKSGANIIRIVKFNESVFREVKFWMNGSTSSNSRRQKMTN